MIYLVTPELSVHLCRAPEATIAAIVDPIFEGIDKDIYFFSDVEL